MSKSIIDAAVGRFLSWRLPDDFAPDCGIVFHRDKVDPRPGWWPIGTNLLTANQARAMFEHCLAQTAAPAEPKLCSHGNIRDLVNCSRCMGNDQSGEVASATRDDMGPCTYEATSPDPDDLVGYLYQAANASAWGGSGGPEERPVSRQKLREAAARIFADRERIAKLGKANDQLFALGKSNYERAERAESEVARLTQELDAAISLRKLAHTAKTRAEESEIRCAAELDEARVDNAKLRRVVEAGKVMLDRGVEISQKYLEPPYTADRDAIGEYIEVFDGPLQRAFDAAVADLEKP